MARPREHIEGLTKVIPFRLSEADAHLFKLKIAQSGMTQSEFIRDCVLKNRTTVIARVQKSSIEKRRMQFVFNKTGNNINQIAHVLNSANLTGKLSDHHYRVALSNLDNISRYLMSALRHVD